MSSVSDPLSFTTNSFEGFYKIILFSTVLTLTRDITRVGQSRNLTRTSKKEFAKSRYLREIATDCQSHAYNWKQWKEGWPTFISLLSAVGYKIGEKSNQLVRVSLITSADGSLCRGDNSHQGLDCTVLSLIHPPIVNTVLQKTTYKLHMTIKHDYIKHFRVPYITKVSFVSTLFSIQVIHSLQGCVEILLTFASKLLVTLNHYPRNVYLSVSLNMYLRSMIFNTILAKHSNG